MNFTKFLRTYFDRTLPDDCSLCLSENFEKFLRTPLLYSTLFQVQVTEFRPPDTKETISQVLFKHFVQEQQVAIRRR